MAVPPRNSSPLGGGEAGFAEFNPKYIIFVGVFWWGEAGWGETARIVAQTTRECPVRYFLPVADLISLGISERLLV